MCILKFEEFLRVLIQICIVNIEGVHLDSSGYPRKHHPVRVKAFVLQYFTASLLSRYRC